MNICPNCQTPSQEGDAFCRNCGIPFNQQLSNGQPIQQNITQNINVQQQNVIDDDELINAYIGTNVDGLRKGNSSFCAFFFSFMYLLYRKMYLLGFGWYIILIISDIFLPQFADYIDILLCVIAAVQFKKYYLNHVTEEVEKIKAENPGKSKEELMMICNKKGGTTIVPIVIFIALIFLFICMIMLGYRKII